MHEHDVFTWRQLKRVYALGKLHWKSFSHMFCNAINLIQIPNQDLLQTDAKYIPNTGEITNGSIVFNWDYMFYNCKLLTHMPKNMKIHHNCINLSYMFANAFKNNDPTLINSYKPSFFPETGFNNSDIDISHCLENCTALKSDVNNQQFGKNLWYSEKTFTSENAFLNTNISNIEKIPKDWGGGRKSTTI